METKFKISIRLMTYNHSKYIRECMNGIFSQKVNFPVEVVVGDDFSNDQTLEIIKEYKNSEYIFINILKRSKGDDYWIKRKKFGRLVNFSDIVENCKGEYIALLDGDDYWIDPFKLQKQARFLDSNPSVSACFTNAEVLNEDTGKIEIYKNYMKLRYDINDAIRSGGSLYPTGSFMFRNIINPLPSFFNEAEAGDRALALLLGRLGDLALLNEITCVYRKHDGGVFTSIINNNTRRLEIDKSNIELLKKFNSYSNFQYDNQIRKAISTRSLISLLRFKENTFNRNKRGLFLNLNLMDTLRFIKNYAINKSITNTRIT